jgi:hypothetical protein
LRSSAGDADRVGAGAVAGGRVEAVPVEAAAVRARRRERPMDQTVVLAARPAMRDSAKVPAIRAAVADVLATPGYAAEAQRLAGPSPPRVRPTAVAELEALASGARVGALR